MLVNCDSEKDKNNYNRSPKIKNKKTESGNNINVIKVSLKYL